MFWMAWFPWVIAAVQVGCPGALYAAAWVWIRAPVLGFSCNPVTVASAKFDV